MAVSDSPRPARSARAWAAAAGVLAAAGGLGAGTLVASFVEVATPVEAVANRIVDLSPAPFRTWAIETVGTADKPVLLGGVMIVLTVVAAAIGILGLRRSATAYGLTGVVGIAAIVAAFFERTGSGAVIPGIVALTVSLALLIAFLHALELSPRAGGEWGAGFSRRSFLALAGAGGLLAVLGGLSPLIFRREGIVDRARVALPRVADPAGPVPAGVQAKADGISRYLTSSRDFYRVDTVLRVPDLVTDDYVLRVFGRVDTPLELSYRDLLRERLVERRITLACVSNPVGGPLVGNATWIGVPVRDILARAGVRSGADAVRSVSADGWTCGTPLEALTDDRDALIAIAMNGEPLPLEHGFPVRLVVPGLYGYVSATKWLTQLEVTRFSDFTAYWTPRGWDEQAPVKSSSRIDVPSHGDTLPRAEAVFAGVAWAPTEGVEKVELSIDGGAWFDAQMAAFDTPDTWRLWSWHWRDARRGNHEIRVRATDGAGELQSGESAPPAPNGASGYHMVEFAVEA